MSLKKLVTALLLLAALLQAQDIRKMGSLKAEVTLSWSMEILNSPGQTEGTLNTFTVEENQWQQVISRQSSEQQNTSNESSAITLSFTIDERKKITHKATVYVDYQQNEPNATASYPFQTPPELQEYTKESPLVIITPEIQSQAQKLAAGSNDALEIYGKLVEWTHNYLTYDIEYGEVNQSSAWVYENKRGTCDEYAHLLIALARSLGIPARYATGYVLGLAPSPQYENQLDWVPHGWTELYLPNYGWLPADATYNQLGVLDASHIKLTHGKDQSNIKETAEANVKQGGSIKFKKETAINILDSREFIQMAELKLYLPNETQPETQTIILQAKNPSPYVRFLPITLSYPKEMTLEEKEEKLVYLKPLEEKNITYHARIKPLTPGTITTFPIEAITLGTTTEAFFTKTVYLPGQKPPEETKPAPTEKTSACTPATALLATILLAATALRQ